MEASNCGGGQKITEAEYNAILAVIRNRPAAEGKGYRLKTDLTWEGIRPAARTRTERCRRCFRMRAA
ncbi:MAG: hypothetical protein V8S57_08125 [Oscillospiraceae bacterium]